MVLRYMDNDDRNTRIKLFIVGAVAGGLLGIVAGNILVGSAVGMAAAVLIGSRTDKQDNTD